MCDSRQYSIDYKDLLKRTFELACKKTDSNLLKLNWVKFCVDNKIGYIQRVLPIASVYEILNYVEGVRHKRFDKERMELIDFYCKGLKEKKSEQEILADVYILSQTNSIEEKNKIIGYIMLLNKSDILNYALDNCSNY